MITLFQKKLERDSGRKLHLKINDNFSTMLSVRWEPDYTKVSLHRMFLQAPQNVMKSLACYISQKHREIAPNIKWFIDEQMGQLNYSSLLNRRNLCAQGSTYHLQKIYDELSQEYFNEDLNILITWYGRAEQLPRTRIALGLYHDTLKLIKIHRVMDNPLFPRYVVEFIVFHEMLHHVCPAYHDAAGIQHIHSKEFKAMESKYRHYQLAEQWLKEHQSHLFRDWATIS